MRFVLFLLMLSGLLGCGDEAASPPAEMVYVSGGGFLRGSPRGGSASEQPSGVVEVRGFWIDRTEVTVAAYAGCVEAGGCEAPSTSHPNCVGSNAPDNNWLERATRGEHPVNCVSWFQAAAYCAWAGKRLPTEAEWEKAARGPQGQTYPWGEAPVNCALAVLEEGGNGCGLGTTWPVGSRPAGASPYGALDMSGNVWEWTQDCYAPRYSAALEVNPTGPPCEASARRVGRGGSYHGGGAATLRSAHRGSSAPGEVYRVMGFRCAR